jgi:hypothetical protein
MVKGDGTYGTWTTTIHASFVPGLYTLASVILMDGAGNPTMVNVTGRSFYVTGDGSAFATADALPTLDLIYTVLNTSTLENGSSTTLKLDARDSVGVSTVTAVITDSSGGSKTLQLHRVAGTPEYGTWIGIINATQPDTTYLVSKVTLSNGNESKEYPITDRSFYVQALPPVENGMGLVTGAATQFSAFSRDAIARMLEQPLVPVLTGFGIMVIVLGALYLNFRMRKLQGTNER